MPHNKESSSCCTQVVNTRIFESYQTNRTFKNFQELNCKSSFRIYLMECTLCKIQFVGKTEAPFNIPINNKQKKMKATPSSMHFNQPDYNFKNHKKFIFAGKINNTVNTDRDIIRISSKRREDFWILKHVTLTPTVLNQEANII